MWSTLLILGEGLTIALEVIDIEAITLEAIDTVDPIASEAINIEPFTSEVIDTVDPGGTDDCPWGDWHRDDCLRWGSTTTLEVINTIDPWVVINTVNMEEGESTLLILCVWGINNFDRGNGHIGDWQCWSWGGGNDSQCRCNQHCCSLGVGWGLDWQYIDNQHRGNWCRRDQHCCGHLLTRSCVHQWPTVCWFQQSYTPSSLAVCLINLDGFTWNIVF